MTSGRNVNVGGTSITLGGVLPVRGKVKVGLAGSSLVMVKVQLFCPADVGVKRMVRFNDPSWLMVAGKGLP